MKIKSELDLTKKMENARAEHEAKILGAVLKHFNINDYGREHLTGAYENVEKYSIRAFTVRYKGVLMYRRFQTDLFNPQFRYEAPIFNNVSEPK